MKTYLDASFLVSLYCADANSEAAIRQVRSLRHEYVVSTLAELEVGNALELRVFRKEISRTQARASWDDLASDLRDGTFQLQALPDQLFARAMLLSRQTTARFDTRTAVLLHVAAALELGCEGLYSFDQRQRELARAVRLKLN